MSDQKADQCCFCCDKCVFETKNESEFKIHYANLHTFESGYLCRKCGRVFTSPENLISHVKSDCSKIQDIVMRCGVENCQHFTTCPFEFMSHLKFFHRSVPLFSCSDCGQFFTIPIFLVMHIQLECPDRLNKKVCKPTDSQSDESRAHLEPNALVNAPQPKPAICSTKNPYVLVEKLSPTSKNWPSNLKRHDHCKRTGKVADNSWQMLNPFQAKHDDSDPDDPTWEPDVPCQYATASYYNKIPKKRSKKQKQFATSTTSLASANQNSITVDEESDSDDLSEPGILIRSLISKSANEEEEKLGNQSNDMKVRSSDTRGEIKTGETKTQMQTEVSSETEIVHSETTDSNTESCENVLRITVMENNAGNLIEPRLQIEDSLEREVGDIDELETSEKLSSESYFEVCSGSEFIQGNTETQIQTKLCSSKETINSEAVEMETDSCGYFLESSTMGNHLGESQLQTEDCDEKVADQIGAESSASIEFGQSCPESAFVEMQSEESGATEFVQSSIQTFSETQNQTELCSLKETIKHSEAVEMETESCGDFLEISVVGNQCRDLGESQLQTEDCNEKVADQIGVESNASIEFSRSCPVSALVETQSEESSATEFVQSNIQTFSEMEIRSEMCSRIETTPPETIENNPENLLDIKAVENNLRDFEEQMQTNMNSENDVEEIITDRNTLKTSDPNYSVSSLVETSEAGSGHEFIQYTVETSVSTSEIPQNMENSPTLNVFKDICQETQVQVENCIADETRRGTDLFDNLFVATGESDFHDSNVFTTSELDALGQLLEDLPVDFNMSKDDDGRHLQLESSTELDIDEFRTTLSGTLNKPQENVHEGTNLRAVVESENQVLAVNEVEQFKILKNSSDIANNCLLEASTGKEFQETQLQPEQSGSTGNDDDTTKGAVIKSDTTPTDTAVTGCNENETVNVQEIDQVAGPVSAKNFQSWNDRQWYITSLKLPEALSSMHHFPHLVKFFKCMSYSCTFTTDCKLKFVDHLVREHCNAKLPCLYCLELFDAGIELVEHTISSHNHCIYQCGQCLYRAATTRQLHRHSESVHDNVYSLLLDSCNVRSRK